MASTSCFRRLRALVTTALLSGSVCAVTSTARAQFDLSDALRSLAKSGARKLPDALLRSPDRRVGVVAEYPPGSAVSDWLVAGRYRPLWLTPDELTSLAADHPELLLHWAPPRRVQLDEASKWIRAGAFRNATGLSGRGVVVGIIDTGIDVTHADLRTSDGKSRVRYLLDFSRTAAGLEPDLEDEYGCTGDTDCAIFSNEDLDELMNNGVTGDEPRDTLGHGTHVASLAAGNGLASPEPRYIGVAPEATIFAARVSRAGDGAIQDPAIIQATRFIFERAAALGMPAVVNLSLGSDFGTHDGSSALERALASFVGSDQPGRAVVVSAGNSGTLFGGIGSSEPEPYGIHTEVHVPRESPVGVPILTPSEALGGRRGGTVYAWIGFRAGDDVSVSLDDDGKDWIPEIAPGQAGTYKATDYEGTIFNGPSSAKSSIQVAPYNAVIVIDGDFDPGRVFTIHLSGHGTASLWLQGSGGASPDAGVGPLFPRGEKQGTINLPASHPDLIAVGATVNRNRWRDSKNRTFLVGNDDGTDKLADVDGTASFSAAGPTALGVMKPDIVAPGMYVVGAMSSAADPRKNGGMGLFASQGRCGKPDYECFVANDGTHAVTSGTSMSAPLVAGAIALLFEKRPELTQPQVRALLQAGAHEPAGPILSEQQLGPGELDLLGTLAALDAEDSPIDRVPSAMSRVSLAASFAHPDPNQPLSGLIELRDDHDRIADGFDQRRLELEVRGASLSKPPARVAPGLYTFEITAPEGSSGRKLAAVLRFDGAVLAKREVPIGTDRWAAEGQPQAHGGCAYAGSSRGSFVSGCIALLAMLGVRRRRRFTS